MGRSQIKRKTQGAVQEWGRDGLVPALCRQDGVVRGRAVPSFVAHFLERALEERRRRNWSAPETRAHKIPNDSQLRFPRDRMRLHYLVPLDLDPLGLQQVDL